MKIGVWNYYEVFNDNNSLFLNASVEIDENLLSPFHEMYLYGKKHDIHFMTLDVVEKFEDMDGFLFLDFPNLKNSYVKQALKLDLPKYLVIFESEAIKPDNWNSDNHKIFDKIFTWSDELIDNNKYFKLNFPHSLPKTINKDVSQKKKLCTLIARNNRINYPLELYTKREEAIRWFEKFHPNDFDLYGGRWDIHMHQNRYIRSLLRRAKMNKLFKAHFPSFKGSVSSKKNTLEKYKFSICYENARDIPGYITEKIFDCFLAGCVPVYWGANNITDHVPSDCFIDKREFNSYEELYQYMSNISDEEYIQYLDNIELFFNSDKVGQFTNEYFIKTIVSNISKQSK